MLVLCAPTVFSEPPVKFLLFSSPTQGRISYFVLPARGTLTNSSEPHVLVDTGIESPMGIAVDQYRNRLLVADPAGQQIVAFELLAEGETLQASEPLAVAAGVEARWVAVDGRGNVFFTVEGANQISTIGTGDLSEAQTPRVLYEQVDTAEVSSPGGIAADNFHLYWTNKAAGQEVGSVIRAMEARPAEGSGNVEVRARNAERSYGVCLALDNIFYTAPTNQIHGVKTRGGFASVITSELGSPRGCVWDGDGTVYVADRTGNALFSFAGAMSTLQQVEMTRAADAHDAFDLDVYHGPFQSRAAGACRAHMVALALGVALLAVLG